MHYCYYMPKIIIILTTFLHHLLTPCLSECRSQCGKIPINYPLSIDDGCGAPQFRYMFTCNTSTSALFFNTPNGNYKVESIDYKAQTLIVYDPDMSTCNVLQPHHDLHLSDIQYAIIPPSSDTVFALLNCSVDSPILHRYSSLCFEFSGHKCPELYSSCNSFRVFTTGGGLVNPGSGNNTGPNGYFYGGGGGGGGVGGGGGFGSGGGGGSGDFNNSTGIGGGGGGGNLSTRTRFSTGGSISNYNNNNNNNMGFEPPSGGFGTGADGGSGSGNNMGGGPPGGGFGTGAGGDSGNNNNNNMGGGPPGGDFGTGASGGSGNNNNMGGGTAGGDFGTGVSGGSSNNNMGAGGVMGPGAPGGGTPTPPCCFTGYSTLKVMSMDILDCTHFTSFYGVDKLKGVGPMDWSYGLKFSYSVPDMGCERCTKSGGSCGFDVQTEALLCLCPDSNNSTRQCGNDMDDGRRGMPPITLQMFLVCLGVLFILPC